MNRIVIALTLAALSAVSAHSQGAGTGTIVGVVTMGDAGAPLPYSSIQLVTVGRERLADADGGFRLDSLPPGVIRVLVRHVGYSPVERTITVIAGGIDTLRIALNRIVIQLAAVKVTADAYCGRSWSAARGDTNVRKILDQLIENADRNRLLVRENPYRFTMAREFAVVAERKNDTVGRVTQRDTVHRQSAREWRYAPGTMIGILPGEFGPTPILNLLELSDIADDVFLDNHCWQYRGFEVVAGVHLIRLDFEPAKSVKVPDVSGSFFLDSATYQLRQSIIRINHSLPSRGMTTVDQHIEVTTSFKEHVAGVPMFDRVVSRIEQVAATPCRDVPGPPIGKYDSVTHKIISVPTMVPNCPPVTRSVTQETQRFLSMSAANDSTKR